MDRQAAINIAKEYISHLSLSGYIIRSSYLFGSFAKGTNHIDSDIDIAIILNDFSNSHDEMVKMMKLRRKISFLIEPHPIREVDFVETNPLFNEIKTNGIQIS
ncbi:MAG: nucleotidyltransferase domain-containing protein [Ignavibacteriaceae bacterium]|nr:nucleotidyltransferase domain-containing protein [Ignavibacteriaceae bacterium]